jgi:uncharacterized protein YndB with AHSA1/START domain
VTKGLVATANININVPVDAVWKALVDPALIKQYMFGTDVVSDWKIGGPIIWKGEWQGKHYKDKGVILKFEPPHLLRYSHFSPLTGRADRQENYHTVTIELAREGNTTGVTLTQDKNEDEADRVNSRQNWQMMLEGLKHLLEKQTEA